MAGENPVAHANSIQNKVVIETYPLLELGTLFVIGNTFAS